jgi:plasmid stability protein
MAVNITIRNVPGKVRDTLAARAGRAGMSLQEFLRSELVALAEKPSIDEWLARVQKRRSEAAAQLTTQEILAYRDADRR